MATIIGHTLSLVALADGALLIRPTLMSKLFSVRSIHSSRLELSSKRNTPVKNTQKRADFVKIPALNFNLVRITD